MRDEYPHPAGLAANVAEQPGPELDRLPPPVFPPGKRRIPLRRGRGDVSSDAPSDPDSTFPEGAFIFPDDEGFDPEGVVSGIGSEGPLYYPSPEPDATDAPGLHEVVELLEILASELKEQGSQALLAKTGGPFESTLRGLVAGYLLGRDEDA